MGIEPRDHDKAGRNPGGKLDKADWELYKILCKNININPLKNIDEVAEEFANDIQNICEITVPKTSNKPRKIRPPPGGTKSARRL